MVVIIPIFILELRLRLILGVDVVGVEVDGTKVGLMLEEQASNELDNRSESESRKKRTWAWRWSLSPCGYDY